jgi:hypothetical protein
VKLEQQPLEYLSEEQLDELLELTGNPFSEENERAIQDKFQQKINETVVVPMQKKRKFTKKVAFLTCAAVAVLLATGFAFRDDVKVALLKQFGDESTKLLLNADKLDTSVTDKGYRLSALSSFRDQTTTYFLSELTGLDGQKLSKNMQIENWQMLGGGNTQVVDYNEQTNSVILLTRAIQMENEEAGDDGFILKGFSMGGRSEEARVSVDWAKTTDQPVQWIDITKQTAQGGGWNEELSKKYGVKTWEKLIATGIDPVKIPLPITTDNKVALSGIGEHDGLLHLQVKAENSHLYNLYDLTLMNKKTQKKVSSLGSFQVDVGTHSNDTGRSDYEEYVFPEITKKDLEDYDLVINYSTNDVYQTGDWSIRLKKPTKLETKEFGNRELTAGNQTLSIKNITISPLTLSATVKAEKLDVKKDLVFTLHLKDGSTKEVEVATSFEHGDYTDTVSSEYGYLDIAQISDVTVAWK